MMRYPAYNVSVIYEWDKKTGYIEKRYKLTERDWWKEAMKSTGASKHGLSKPYVDSRENMPQPRTFWYKIRLTNPDATAVLGVDFIFKPIKRPIKRQKKE